MSKRAALLHFALPILFIAPEVINLGIIFLRWDYILIAYILTNHFISRPPVNSNSSLAWSRATTGIFLIYLACFILMAIRAGEGEELISGIKYAAWPVKSILWAVGVWYVLSRLNGSALTVYSMLRTMVILVFAMQILEMTLPSFRDWLFKFYPVAAEERLRELNFRARGPFNGYDTASIFFAVCAVYFHEVRRRNLIYASHHFFLIFLSLAGAFLAARTGFILAISYLALSRYSSANAYVKIITLSFVIALYIFLPNYSSDVYAEDTGLLSRYLEVLQAVFSGNILEVSSFSGTFHMNSVLIRDGMDLFWGEGVSTSTTADQLYFKYLYMFGVVGLTLWTLIHISMLLTISSKKQLQNEGIAARSAGIAIVVMLGLAHIKGGNYFFSARLGEIIAIMLLTATLDFKRSRSEPRYAD